MSRSRRATTLNTSKYLFPDIDAELNCGTVLFASSHLPTKNKSPHHRLPPTAMGASPRPLDALPSELLLHILSYLDIPDLLALTRTSHPLRALSLDPLLHTLRLHRASLTLQHSLSARPELTELIAHRIYITRTHLAARSLGRSLISIKLNRRLQRRPSVEQLVGWGVLPRECVGREGGRGASGGLVDVKRKVEKERVKDALRAWVGEWRRRGVDQRLAGEGERIDVRRMARRFAREGREEREMQRWGEGVKRKGEEPARARVLGLRRFWERVGRETGAGAVV